MPRNGVGPSAPASTRIISLARRKPRSVGRPAGKSGADSRNEIVAAAMAVAATAGVERLTIASVAAAAGTTKTSVLHHFRSREGLLEALAKRSTTSFVENIVPESGDVDLSERARRSIRAFFRASYRSPASVTNQIMSLGMYDPDAARWSRRLWKRRIEIVEASLRQIAPPFRRSTAEAVIAAVQGATTLWLTSGGRNASYYYEIAWRTVRVLLAAAARQDAALGPVSRLAVAPTPRRMNDSNRRSSAG